MFTFTPPPYPNGKRRAKTYDLWSCGPVLRTKRDTYLYGFYTKNKKNTLPGTITTKWDQTELRPTGPNLGPATDGHLLQSNTPLLHTQFDEKRTHTYIVVLKNFSFFAHTTRLGNRNIIVFTFAFLHKYDRTRRIVRNNPCDIFQTNVRTRTHDVQNTKRKCKQVYISKRKQKTDVTGELKMTN